VARRVIVVPTASVSDALLQTVVWAHAGQDAEIHVVAPASNISRLDWLTNADAEARGGAQTLADDTAEAVPTDNVEAHVGDSDPLQAIEDALRTFPADEVIIITLPEESAAWLESGAGEEAQRRFALPVTHLIATV
jgi:hypothetical protein